MKNRFPYQFFNILIENAVQSIIYEALPRSWEEKHISFELIKKLRQVISGVELIGLDCPLYFSCDAFKLKGKLEQTRGDIAVLVVNQSLQGKSFEGVGFLEAKKKYKDSGKYEGIKIDQLDRIKSNTPLAYVLLYDWLKITGFGDNLSFSYFHRNFADWNCPLYHYEPLANFSLFSPFTHALAVPVCTAIQLINTKELLYNHGIPLSVLLCARFFRGFDLEFDSSIVQETKGFAEREFGGVSLLLVVAISPSSIYSAPSPDVNFDLYERLD